MTHRERLFAVLEGRPTDCVPIWLLFPYHAQACYVDVHHNPCYTSLFEASKRYALMLDRRSLYAELFMPEVQKTKETICGPSGSIQRTTLRYGEHCLQAETRERDGQVEVVKHLLQDETDLMTFAQLSVNVDPAAIRRELDAQLANYLQEKSEFPEEYGAMMLDLGEPIGTLYSSANLLEYPVWSLTQNDCVVGILSRLMERLKIIYTYALEHNLADVYFLVGSELASPPMVSRRTFQQWIVPYAKELIGLIHSYGKKVIQHYHGQIKEILPDFLAMAPDGLHTIEAPPVGNCTLTEAFEVLRDRITLIGNIQYDCFRAYTEHEMRQAVRVVIEEGRGKRFILSPSAGPYEHIISDAMIRNYHAFMEAGFEYGANR
ncbi:MAG: uroporphyrinogen decarboxylase family protein [Verrucomicrobiota bacterium]